MAIPPFLGSIDQGTTSSRFIIFDSVGAVIVKYQQEFEQLHPQPGWTEHDPKSILTSIENCIEAAVQQFTSLGYSISQIQAIGITNQRETTCVWDKTAGEYLHNAIVWLDTRTNETVSSLEWPDRLKRKCGCKKRLMQCR